MSSPSLSAGPGAEQSWDCTGHTASPASGAWGSVLRVGSGTGGPEGLYTKERLQVEGESLEWGRLCQEVGNGPEGVAWWAAFFFPSLPALALLLLGAWPCENKTALISLP